MKKIGKLIMFVAIICLTTSCYEKFDMPEPTKVWDKESLKEKLGEDVKFMSIKDFKQLFYDEYGTGNAGLGRRLDIEDNIVISGKVISSDFSGNVYKSVYLYDNESESAIEIKLMVSNYVYYQKGQTIYVATKGLCIGNYRYMLSVGARPTEADIAKGYANRNLDNSVLTDKHIFEGKQGEISEDDILVVNKDNYKEKLGYNKNGFNIEYDVNTLGRLIRFEGITYKKGVLGKDMYPNFLETTYPGGSTQAVYTNKTYKDERKPDTYAYCYDNNRYYGSSWFTLNPTSSSDADGGHFIVRVSGYAKFGLRKLPEDNAEGNITAIFTKYSSKSGSFIKHQLLINDFEDIEFSQATDKVE